jgi:electron transfer flavoprotein alpha/beta subunit
MKFYVASSYELKHETKHAQKLIKHAGHTITGDWTTHLEIAHAPNADQLSLDYAIEDAVSIKEADVFVLLLGERKSTGAHIELGIAIGAGLTHIYLVGEMKDFTLFYKYPNIKHVNSIETILAELEI